MVTHWQTLGLAIIFTEDFLSYKYDTIIRCVASNFLLNVNNQMFYHTQQRKSNCLQYLLRIKTSSQWRCNYLLWVKKKSLGWLVSMTSSRHYKKHYITYTYTSISSAASALAGQLVTTGQNGLGHYLLLCSCGRPLQI